MYHNKVTKNQRILAVFSDVDSSPQLLSIMVAAKQNGFVVDVVIFGHNKNPLFSKLLENGISTKQIKPRSKLKSGILFMYVAWKIFSGKPDILFASGLYANVVGLTVSYVQRVKRRIFIRHHSNFHSKDANYFGLFTDKLCNYLSTEIVAVSKLVQEILIENEYVESKKVHLIHNGIDLSLFNNDRNGYTGLKDTSPKSDFKIGIVSRMTNLKGIAYAAKAFVQIHREFPHATLSIIGQFSDSFCEVSQILEALPSSSYQLMESTESIPKFLSDLDIFVHVPIGREYESFGLVYLEALAANLSCIFTISGVLLELPKLEEYTYVVDYKSSEGIYRALYGLMIDESQRKPKVPHSWLNQFELENMSKGYLKLFVNEGPS